MALRILHLYLVLAPARAFYVSAIVFFPAVEFTAITLHTELDTASVYIHASYC